MATASSRSWSRNGLIRKSTAPAFIALTDIGTSPCPVMKMIGISIFGLGELGLKIEPAALRQPDVEHKTARHIGQLGLQQLRSRPEQLDAQTHRAQQAAQRFAQRRIVVDDNDHGLLRGRCIARWRAAVHDAATNGTVNWKVTPAPSLQEAHSRPPCPSTIERQIERPIPIPSALVVKKALNTRSS